MISDKGINLITTFEGLKLKAYPDPGTGNTPYTIGYGHTKNVKPNDVCTKEQAVEWLKQDVNEVENQIKNLVKTPLTQNQLDALISFVYNVGVGNFKSSTLLKLLNNSKYNETSLEFAKWNKANNKILPGLVKRRAAEAELFKN